MPHANGFSPFSSAMYMTSPLLKSPCVFNMPDGNRLAFFNNACLAPASTQMCAVLNSATIASIQVFRDSSLPSLGSKRVPVKSWLTTSSNMFGVLPLHKTIGMPAEVTSLAASILVTMPPLAHGLMFLPII